MVPMVTSFLYILPTLSRSLPALLSNWHLYVHSILKIAYRQVKPKTVMDIDGVTLKKFVAWL